MRILHTSDWHLGRSFHREDLLGHQGAFVDHLLDVVASEEVDVVVVAGDVYDRALPHVDAVALATGLGSLLGATARVDLLSARMASLSAVVDDDFTRGLASPCIPEVVAALADTIVFVETAVTIQAGIHALLEQPTSG